MARAAVDPPGDPGGRERFIVAGLRVLQEHGAAELTLRRVAELADSSTMGIYSCFGGRAGMLEAIYRRGFELLKEAITVPRAGTADQARADPRQAIIAIATAYRRFALGNPALYALMFERPLPGFDPSLQLRSWALNLTFTPLVEEVARAQAGGLLAGDDPIRPSYLLWTTVHGITSIELTHAVRSPLQGWFVDSPAAGEQILLEAVRAVLTGLR
ncbi:MAG TPA: TetR/AcrR family transcriptional regulator [Streptosporangiaceae bacterium]|nr:TetR/AcrR family transcriptional regulator [Streptosporangiaceae bacterium]